MYYRYSYMYRSSQYRYVCTLMLRHTRYGKFLTFTNTGKILLALLFCLDHSSWWYMVVKRFTDLSQVLMYAPACTRM